MNRSFRMALIVEGDGEREALPVVIWRWLQHRQCFSGIEIMDPLNARGCGRLKCEPGRSKANHQTGIEYFVEKAAKHGPDAILILLDADKECSGSARPQQERLGPRLLRRAEQVAGHIPIRVVVADPEYEAWLLVAHGSMKIRRDCKRDLRKLLGRPYEERIDQAELSKKLPCEPCGCPSYDRFLRILEELFGPALPMNSS